MNWLNIAIPARCQNPTSPFSFTVSQAEALKNLREPYYGVFLNHVFVKLKKKIKKIKHIAVSLNG